MATTLQKDYKERIVPALEREFNYSTVMQVPRLEKIVINQGIGAATQDKKLIETAINELTAITGQKAVATLSRKDISNFKLRKKMPVGVRVTLRRERMYEFLERLIRVALPRIRDFKGIEGKLDGRGNYTLGITEQIIFPEILSSVSHKSSTASDGCTSPQSSSPASASKAPQMPTNVSRLIILVPRSICPINDILIPHFFASSSCDHPFTFRTWRMRIPIFA